MTEDSRTKENGVCFKCRAPFLHGQAYNCYPSGAMVHDNENICIDNLQLRVKELEQTIDHFMARSKIENAFYEAVHDAGTHRDAALEDSIASRSDK